MKTSIIKFVVTFLIGFSETILADNSNTEAEYIVAIERYDIKTWAASYDSVDRHEVTTGTDRGAQVYVYRSKEIVQRVIFDYGMSHNDNLYCLLYRDGKLVKLSRSERRYRSGKDGEVAFCQPYPQEETNRGYFRGSEVICLSSEDKGCGAIRSDTAKREALLKDASELIRQLSAAKPDSELPDFDFLKYF